MKMLTWKLALILLFGFVCLCHGQQTFVKHYGTSSSEYGTALSLTESSGFLICQTIYQSNFILVGLVKTDANGHKEWDRVYKLRDNTIVKCIEKWKDGYLLLASTWNSGSTNIRTALIRINAAGDVYWVRQYEGSNADLAAGLSVFDDRIYISATADYNIGSVYPKVLWIQADTNGIPIRSKLLAAPYMISAMSSDVNRLGKTGIVCESNSFGIGSFSFTNIVMLQLDSMGNMDWVRSIGTTYDDEASEVAADSLDWLITGRSYFVNTEADLSYYRISQNGNLLFGNFYDAGTLEGEAGRALIVKQDRSCVIAGDLGTFDERNMFLLSISSHGITDWAVEYPVSIQFTNYPYDLIELKNDSGYAFTGDLRPPTMFRNAALFRTDSAGMAGCFSQAVNFIQRFDSIQVIAVSLQDVSFTLLDVVASWLELNPNVQEHTICDFPTANFGFSTDTICPLLCFNFSDASINASSWNWDFPGGMPSSSNVPSPSSICYSLPGLYQVSLIVSNGISSDTLAQTISLGNFCDTTGPLSIPSIISPNGDFLGDLLSINNFYGKFSLHIFNRWGQLVFESTDKSQSWPVNSSSPVSIDGVYYYLLEVFDNPYRQFYRGTLLVIQNR